jgi:hypothetical protein
MNSPPVTLQKALAAYGGEAFWRVARSIRATVSTSGLAFVLKWQKPFRRIGVECGVREPITRLTPIDEAGNIGVLRQGDVFLENPSGSVIARRRNARSFSLTAGAFSGGTAWIRLILRDTPCGTTWSFRPCCCGRTSTGRRQARTVSWLAFPKTSPRTAPCRNSSSIPSRDS